MDWQDADQDIMMPSSGAQPANLSALLRIPKVELHAHLNGSLAPRTLRKLLSRRPDLTLEQVQGALHEIDRSDLDFTSCFRLFGVVHQLVRTAADVELITYDVVEDFANDGTCYLELRSTLKDRPEFNLNKETYLQAVLTGLDRAQRDFPIRVKFIVSINRSRSLQDAWESLHLAIKYKSFGVVGIDLCDDPEQGSTREFMPVLTSARQHGLKLALHVAETETAEGTGLLMALRPDRIGHGTCLPFGRLLPCYRTIPVEVCLSSNIMSKSCTALEVHHVLDLAREGHPFVICTDDKGIFRTTLTREYELAASLLGWGVYDLARMSRAALEYGFLTPMERQSIVERFFDPYFSGEPQAKRSRRDVQCR